MVPALIWDGHLPVAAEPSRKYYTVIAYNIVAHLARVPSDGGPKTGKLDNANWLGPQVAD